MSEQQITRTRRIRLGYLQTIKAQSNELDLLAAGGSAANQKRELTFVDQKDTYIPGAGGVQPGEAIRVEAHSVGDTGWLKDEVIQTVMYDRGRIAVGIRDLEFNSVRYADNGILITKPYATRNPIKAISLIVNEFIPEIFPKGQYIFYSISFDGDIWYELLPKNSSLSTKIAKRLTVNFTDSDDKSSESVSATGEPVKLYLKIELRHPIGEEFAGATPILRHYDLHVEVKK